MSFLFFMIEDILVNSIQTLYIVIVHSCAYRSTCGLFEYGGRVAIFFSATSCLEARGDLASWIDDLNTVFISSGSRSYRSDMAMKLQACWADVYLLLSVTSLVE